ncbi:cobalt-precorrin-5B (C(1))-methyltransferase CbiD [uncultured Bacteroides sp.]|uniref:cobalt-precorrin-5B (C(1))-methyltransferase CbiD n=1 Tax=uncultured Bacteroides sp. TaxID=162156 RepID=UPI002AA81395|nr:cobalt-precorrin-5B (C(1))-methyltransferase CbiD [uncultured Bacteroides sp.]
MILILGGTTEGKAAVRVVDEAGQPYYYSTRGEWQEVSCLHGTRLSGEMDKEAMLRFCQENKIHLLIDAAHPFAVQLHQNIADAAEELSLPVIRYERIYPARDEDFVWCEDYEDALLKLETRGIQRLLALTGVQTIGKLRRYWTNHTCWFRILERESSVQLAKNESFPVDNLCFYHPDESERTLLEKLSPDAIITKESGESGGFAEKVNAAAEKGIPIFVVKRPLLPDGFYPVDGDHGLRKAIEQLLPGFFPLRTGFTTGSCATAAAVAALNHLFTEQEQQQSTIILPDGEHISLCVKESTLLSDSSAKAIVIKDAGDDPDVTNGIEIVAEVSIIWEKSCSTATIPPIILCGGPGVGRVTLPGLGLEIGGPAINLTPRTMIRENLIGLLDKAPYPLASITVTISVPTGVEIAKRTFNPRLGIENGISIIGTSGIVKPFSLEAFVNSIRKEIEVAKATGSERLVINSGAKSERFVCKLYPELPAQAFVHYGNFIGETIQIAAELSISKVTMGIMIGKAVKLAEGALDTHSKNVTMNKVFLQSVAREAGCTAQSIDSIDKITLARELWTLLSTEEQPAFFSLLIQHCRKHAAPLLPDGELTIVLLTEGGEVFK